MAYTELRKFLVSDGYLKLQPDVFLGQILPLAKLRFRASCTTANAEFTR